MTPGDTGELTVDLADATIAALQTRAFHNGRSVNDELLPILDAAVRDLPDSP